LRSGRQKRGSGRQKSRLGATKKKIGLGQHFPPRHKENFSQKETLFTLAKASFSEWDQNKTVKFSCSKGLKQFLPVSPSTFMMPNENGQASMDFLFVLFLQLIQSALDILNPSEEPNSDLGAMNSQDAKPNYQRALNFMEDNPSLKETFNQAISFVLLLSQFVYDKEVKGQDVSLSININNTANKELKLINIASKDLKFSLDPKALFLPNQASSLTDDKGLEPIKPILLSNNTLQSLSAFISKAWKEYKALLKEKGEEININMQSINKEFFVKLNTDWEGLPEEAKAYLKEVLANSIFNQNKMGHNVYPNLKNSLNSNGINEMQGLSAEKKTGVNEMKF
jgi:hypothetical protein